MKIKKKHKKMSKTKHKRLTKKWIGFYVSFLLIEIVLISLFIYFLRDNQYADSSDVYKAKAEIIKTEIGHGHYNKKLYFRTSIGNFITTGRYVGSNQRCEELASLLIKDPQVELTVLKNSDSFFSYFMDDASTIVGIKSETAVYSTVEQYNDYIESNRFFLILSFVVLEIITIGIATWSIVFRRAIFD